MAHFFSLSFVLAHAQIIRMGCYTVQIDEQTGTAQTLVMCVRHGGLGLLAGGVLGADYVFTAFLMPALLPNSFTLLAASSTLPIS